MYLLLIRSSITNDKKKRSLQNSLFLQMHPQKSNSNLEDRVGKGLLFHVSVHAVSGFNSTSCELFFYFSYFYFSRSDHFKVACDFVSLIFN